MSPRSTGHIPDSWLYATLGDVTVPRVEQRGPEGAAEFTYVDISSVDNRTKRITAPARLHVSEAPSRARQLLQPGDVLVSMTRPNLNAVAFITDEFAGAIGSTGFHILRSSGIEPKWLFYAVQSKCFIDAMTAVVQGALYPAVRPHDIRSYRVPIPPLGEQRRIISALEEHLSDLDDATAGLERALSRLRSYRFGAIRAALNESLTNEKTSDWQTHRIELLANVGTGATPLRSNKAYYEGGTIPWVTSGALNESFVSRATEFVTELALRETNLTVYPAGTLLVAMYGEGKTRGKCSELAIPAATNQAVAAIQLRPEWSDAHDFLKLWLTGAYADMRSAASGGVQPNLNLGIIKGMRVRVPDREARERIVAEASQRLAASNRMQRDIDVQLKRSAQLRNSILRCAFEGRLVPQDAEEEPAVACPEGVRTAMSPAKRSARPTSRRRKA